MIPEPGRRFGPYEIQSRLGGGGMGYVFRAWDTRLHREVALKVLHNEYAMPGMRERFLREARAASALNHPNICTIFDIGEQDGDPYLVMELLEGISLKDRILDSPIPVDQIVCLAREIAEGLGAAHAKGIVHRDVKPANIFLVRKPNGNPQIKVLDFGLAKIETGVLGARGGRTVDLTTAGATVGTLAYMSPEQARGESIDSRSDLFSLGVVLYEMATRQIPFPGATSALVFVKLLNEMPEPIREWNEAIPRDVEKLIFKLIAKERTARFQTALELEQALRQLEEKVASSGTGWLRKAVAAVPLVRAPDPTVRDRRQSRRLQAEGESRGTGSLPEPKLEVAEAGQALEPSAAENQVVRPVARVPKVGSASRQGGLTVDNGLTHTGEPAADAGAQPQHAGAQNGHAGVQIGPKPARELFAESQAQPVGSPEGSTRPDVPAEQPAPGVLPVLAAAAAEAAKPPETARASAAPAYVPQSKLPAAQPTPTAGGSSAARLSNPSRPSRQILVAAFVALALIAGIVALIRFGHLGRTLLTANDRVVVTSIENRTGNRLFDGSVAEGLAFALRQSPFLQLTGQDDSGMSRSQAPLPAGGTEVSALAAARGVATRLHARAYIFGSINNAQAPYQLRLQLLDTDSGEVLSSLDDIVRSPEQIPAAIDRAAAEIRENAGESSASVSATTVPLAREASANLEALQAFAQAREAVAGGQTLEALRFYQAAAVVDPHFTQANLQLAGMYRKLHAEVAAADAARLALGSAQDASAKVRAAAQFEYEVTVSGDLPRAINIMRRLLADYPHDPASLTRLARGLRSEGHMSEALQAAQQAYTEDPFAADAYTQAEGALIALDRFDAAYQLDLQAQRLGVAKPGSTLAASYLEGRDAALTEALAAVAVTDPGTRAGYAQDWYFGLYLDNAGRLHAGEALWRGDAAAAARVPGLTSAAAFMLAQGALDRGLLGDCRSALSLAQSAHAFPAGMHALFNLGMAEALCGDSAAATRTLDELRNTYPQSFAVNGFYAADIAAAIDLHAHQPAGALAVLGPAAQYDLISLTPFLRGWAHVDLGQAQIGIVDYQTVLAHRGVTFVIGSDVFPAAQIGVARAFSGTGDASNSSQAYKHFLELWKDADPGQPLLAEALAHVR